MFDSCFFCVIAFGNAQTTAVKPSFDDNYATSIQRWCRVSVGRQRHNHTTHNTQNTTQTVTQTNTNVLDDHLEGLSCWCSGLIWKSAAGSLETEEKFTRKNRRRKNNQTTSGPNNTHTKGKKNETTNEETGPTTQTQKPPNKQANSNHEAD